MDQANVLATIVMFVYGAMITAVWRLWVLSDSLEN